MDAFEQIRRVTLRGDDLAAMLLVIELDEDGLVSLREELHRLLADLFGARHDEILERAVLALQLLDAQLIHETRGENDQRDVREDRPPAEPDRRPHGERGSQRRARPDA